MCSGWQNGTTDPFVNNVNCYVLYSFWPWYIFWNLHTTNGCKLIFWRNLPVGSHQPFSSSFKDKLAFCGLYSFVQLVFCFGLGSSTLAYHVRDISHTSSRTVRALVWQPLRTGWHYLLLPRRITSCRRQWPFRERIGSLEDAPFLVLSLFIWLCRKL